MGMLDPKGGRTAVLRLQIIALTTSIAALIVALLILAGLRAREDALNAARLQTSYLAAAFQEDCDGALNTLAVSAEIARRRIANEGNLAFLAELESDIAKYSPALVNISVVGADGKLRATSGEVTSLPADFSSFEIFQETKNSETLGLRLGRPVPGILPAVLAIPAMERLENHRGEFDGALILLLDPNRAAQMYRRVELGGTGSLMLLGDDGTLFTGYTLPKGFDASVIGSPAVSKAMLAKLGTATVGTFDETSPLDGIQRIYSWRRLMNANGIAVVGLGKDEALAGANQQIARLLVLGVLSIGLLIALTLLLVREISRRTNQAAALSRQRRMLRKSNERLAAAKKKAEEANRGKTLFLANVSHELRTSLNAILGFAEMIRTKTFGHDPERYTAYAADIYDSGAHLLNVVRNLLDLAKIEAGKFELSEAWIDAEEVGARCLQLMRGEAENRGVELAAIPRRSGVHLFADETALRQIILNLLSNAINFTPRGGTVWLIFEPDAEGGLALTVRDSGVGMTEDQTLRAMRPFEQVQNSLSREREGTGLGLPLVAQLAQLQGGVLSIESTPGSGTRATIRFLPSRVKASEQEDRDGYKAATEPSEPSLKEQSRLKH